MRRHRLLRVIAVLPALAGSMAWADLEITPLGRDRVLYDVGAAFGRDAARIPVSGRGLPGRSVDVRLAGQDGGVSTPWVTVAVNPSGAWQAELIAAASPEWFRIEARSGDRQVLSGNRLGTGDIIALMGQSELERLNTTFNATSPVAPIPDPEQVQVTWNREDSGSGVVTTQLSDTTPLTPSLAAMAAFWAANAPEGRKLHIVDLARNGASRLTLARDDWTSWQWSEFRAVVDTVRRDGADIGLVLESWTASDRALSREWSKGFTPFYTGLNTDGSLFELGRDVSAARNVTLDHVLWDLSGQGRGIFEEGVTAFANVGPHRYDSTSTEPRQNALTARDGTVLQDMRAIHLVRQQMDGWLSNDQMARIAVTRTLPTPLDYSNGFASDTAPWTDTTHPSGNSDDGSARFGRHLVAALLLALGHADYDVPVFDRVRVTAEWIELSSSVGPIITARSARGLAPLDDSVAHWTEVFGFELDGQPVHRAELTPAGTVRIPVPADRPRTRRMSLYYGRGGANGFVDPLIDWQARAYLNLPLVDVGLSGLEGVAVRPEPGRDLLEKIPHTPISAPPPGPARKPGMP